MTSIAIIGGRLQGTEAAYLAKKAGLRSLLIDKNPKAPAFGLSDERAVLDVREKGKQLVGLLKDADFILPALENAEALAALVDIAAEHGLKMAFDANAYSVTSSKLKSDRLIKEHQIPAPQYFPECRGPYIVKPSGESGSDGVFRAETAIDARRFLAGVQNPENWVVQEFLDGPSYSIEVIGFPGMYRTYEITQIHMDESYDCKMVTAPCRLSVPVRKEFSGIAMTLAGLVKLSGIMDVEVIDHEGVLKVLEIDARIPSQTPIAVYHSTGVNLLSELADVTLNGGFNKAKPKQRRFAAVEHYLVSDGGAEWKGEHIMCEGGTLLHMKNFFGADEALTDFADGCSQWRGMFINSGETEAELVEKRASMLRMLADWKGAHL
ncbi:MAG: 3-methylornithine--L-lysine ligase PylC [Clostridiales bacterium]|nr:3-methylornithine--L-lysine ligase PylC [Clostridiales bacterium]